MSARYLKQGTREERTDSIKLDKSAIKTKIKTLNCNGFYTSTSLETKYTPFSWCSKRNQYFQLNRGSETVQRLLRGDQNKMLHTRSHSTWESRSAILHLQGVEFSHPGGFKTNNQRLGLKLECDWSINF